jgi:hypothetical protein
MKRSRIKHRKTKRGPEAQRQFDEFKDQWLGKLCWLCEFDIATEAHHIDGRCGDAWDDPRNLAAVCWLCHRRYHDGEQTTITGRKLRQWTDEDVERAKRRWDPPHYDPAYLDYLRYPERYEREHGTMIYQEKDNVPTDV